MKIPISQELIEKCFEHGGAIDMRQGRLVIVTDVLPDNLQKELESAVLAAMKEGIDIKFH